MLDGYWEGMRQGEEKTAYFSFPLISSVSGPPTWWQFNPPPNLRLRQKVKIAAKHSAMATRGV